MKEMQALLIILSTIVNTATQKYFGQSFNVFKENMIYRNAIAMYVLQTGELSGYLSDAFKAKYNGVPWRNIKDMRNIMAHRYGEINITILWETITDDIPFLYDYCKGIVSQDAK